MNKRVTREGAEKRLFSLAEVVSYLGIGKNAARKYMDEIGATRKFGRRVVFDRRIIDQALNNMV